MTWYMYLNHVLEFEQCTPQILKKNSEKVVRQDQTVLLALLVSNVWTVEQRCSNIWTWKPTQTSKKLSEFGRCFCLFVCFCNIFQGRLRGCRWWNDVGHTGTLTEKYHQNVMKSSGFQNTCGVPYIDEELETKYSVLTHNDDQYHGVNCSVTQTSWSWL